MIELPINFPLLIFLIGVIIFMACIGRSFLERIGIPPLVGYILLGFLIRLANIKLDFLSPGFNEIFEFLADLGIIVLLFKVGLECNIPGLLRQLKKASFIWVGNVLISGALGYIVATYVLGLSLIPSLFIAIAFTATSVGITVIVWQKQKALNTPLGELLIDVAEMDDITGIMLMALLFSIIPILKDGTGAALLPILSKTTGILILKLAVFGALCYFLSIYAERHIASFCKRVKKRHESILMVTSVGFIVAALAGLMGFSVAIGAFFAGLIFCRDPEAVKIDASFNILYEFFSPFFFVGIGLSLAPEALATGFWLGLILLIPAVIGKFVGAGGPAILTSGLTGGVLIGVSMIPRAEIAMIIMDEGLEFGAWAVPPHVFAGMVVVVAITCLVTPYIIRLLLRKWPQKEEEKSP